MRNTGVCASIAVALLIAGCSSARSTPHSPTGSATGTTGAPSPSPTASADPAYVVKRIHTGSKPCATLGAAGSVWVADINDNVVKRLDPATGRVIATIATAAGPCGMTFGAGAVWA